MPALRITLAVAAALALVVGALAAAWALTGSSDEPVSAPPPAAGTSAGEGATTMAETTTTVEAAEPAPAGHEVYVAAGCSACHGLNAEGTDVGPALGGHGAEQVEHQVRNPLAQMPAYTEQQLSDADLALVSAYIEGLEAMEDHVEPVKLPEVLALHHWMALSAIAAGDRADALHHVGHVIDASTGAHRAAMVKARAALRRGDLHDAEHEIEEMLAGTAKPDLSLAELNLRLALAAIDRRDKADATHQLEHYVTRVDGAARDKGKAALAHLREGDLHGAEHGIADLLGVKRD